MLHTADMDGCLGSIDLFRAFAGSVESSDGTYMVTSSSRYRSLIQYLPGLILLGKPLGYSACIRDETGLHL